MSNTETSIAIARASVLMYDDTNKKWLPSGSSSGLSRVHIYHNVQNNAFRIVGRKIQDHEVVINCSILKNLKYNQATPTFHQWRENRQVYGLNFSSKDDADAFAHTMLKVIDMLNQNTYGTTKPIQQTPTSMAQPVYGHIGPPEEYGEIRQNGWNGTNNHINNIEQNNLMHVNNMQMMHPQHQMLTNEHLMNNHGNQLMQPNQSAMIAHSQMNNVTQANPQPTYMSSTHLMHRNSISNTSQSSMQMIPPMSQAPQQQAIPPPPPPPPQLTSAPMMPNNNTTTNQTTLTNSNNTCITSAAPPPPPPPPPPSMPINNIRPPNTPLTNGVQSSPVNITTPVQNNASSNLAAAIASAKLKRTTSIKEDSDSSSSNSSTVRAAPGNLMDEMAKTLARRRAQAESSQQNNSSDNESRFNGSSGSTKEKSNLVNGYSPSKDDSASRRNGPSEELKVNGVSDNDMERLKQEIMNDIRKELQKFKLDVIEAFKIELNRR